MVKCSLFCLLPVKICLGIVLRASTRFLFVKCQRLQKQCLPIRVKQQRMLEKRFLFVKKGNRLNETERLNLQEEKSGVRKSNRRYSIPGEPRRNSERRHTKFVTGSVQNRRVFRR